MKLYELRRALQDACDLVNNTDEDRELTRAEVERIVARVHRALVRAYMRAGGNPRARRLVSR